MKYIKTYNKLYEWIFHDEFHKEKIRDVDYYLDRIKKEKISNDSIEQLFHWSCTYNFPELALALVDILGPRILRLSRSITYLEYDTFKKIIEKDDLYKRIETSGKGASEFIKNVIHYGGEDAVKKLELLKKLGFEINNNTLRSACYGNNLKVIKYLVSLGFDASEKYKNKNSYSDIPENCLDIATNYGKDNYDVVEYLVKELKVPVTYRHMYNEIKNEKIFELLMKSDNVVDDYAYSNWSIQEYNKRQLILRDLLRSVSGKDRMDWFKYLVDKSKNKDKHSFIYSLNIKKDWKGFDQPTDDYIDPNQLEMAYYLIKESEYNPHSGVIELIMNNNEEFWFDKMKKDRDLILRLWNMPDSRKQSYEYQKVIFESDSKIVKQFISFNEKIIDEKIMREYDHIPEILELIAKKYNL